MTRVCVIGLKAVNGGNNKTILYTSTCSIPNYESLSNRWRRQAEPRDLPRRTTPVFPLKFNTINFKHFHTWVVVQV